MRHHLWEKVGYQHKVSAPSPSSAITHHSSKKVNRREAMWPGAEWKYVLVHAVVKHPEELREIEKRGVELVPLQTVLEDLCPPERPPFTASAGGDLADLIDFYGRTRQLPLTNEHEDEDHIEDVRAT